LIFGSYLKALISIAKLIFKDDDPLDALKNMYILYFKAKVEIVKKSPRIDFQEKDLKTMKKIISKLSKVYPFYWKNELILSKEKSRFEMEQESY
jgi:hypothetical protein